jgi:hypothetical protein
MRLAYKRMQLATKLLDKAKELLGAEHGVTLLVHGVPGESHPVVAMQTTLPSRTHVRRLCMHVLYQSLIADGVDVDNVHAVAMRELVAMLEQDCDLPA